MYETMNVPWFDFTVFWIVAVLVVTVLAVTLAMRRPGRPPAPPTRRPGWQNLPEVRLVMFGLPLELLWEIAQFPLYDVWHQNGWVYILYGLAHCTTGDLIILFVIYELVALLSRDRYWYIDRVILGGLLFTALGVGYTVYSEIMNVRVKGAWGYTELMPLIPVIDVGGMPFLQWVLIPPILLWLIRLIAWVPLHER